MATYYKWNQSKVKNTEEFTEGVKTLTYSEVKTETTSRRIEMCYFNGTNYEILYPSISSGMEELTTTVNSSTISSGKYITLAIPEPVKNYRKIFIAANVNGFSGSGEVIYSVGFIANNEFFRSNMLSSFGNGNNSGMVMFDIENSIYTSNPSIFQTSGIDVVIPVIGYTTMEQESIIDSYQSWIFFNKNTHNIFDSKILAIGPLSSNGSIVSCGVYGIK